MFPAAGARVMPVRACAELFGALEGIRLRPRPLLILAAAGFSLYVDQRAAAVHVPANHFPGSVGALTAMLREQGISSLQEIDRARVAQEIRDNAFVRIGLDEFSWSLALDTPLDDNLVRQRAATTVFSLRHWPNFTRLPHTQAHMTWTARLVRTPLSLAELALKASLDEAARFYNACLLCGIVEPHAAAPQPVRAATAPAANDSSKVSIFQRIVRKLAS